MNEPIFISLVRHSMAYLGIALTASIVIVGVRSYRVVSREVKILTLYFLIDLCASILSVFFAKHRMNNMPIMNAQIPIEYSFFIIALSFWTANKTIQRVLRYSVLVFIAFSIVSFFFLEDFYDFSRISRPVITAIIIVSAVYVLVHTVRNTSYPVTTQPRFWICAGLLFYNAGNATMFLITNKHLFSIPDETLREAWVIHNAIGLFAYILFLIGFLCHWQQTSPHSGGR